MIKHVLVMLLVSGLSFSAFADAPKKAKKESAQLAGFGIVAPKHTCTMSYQGCLSNCKTSGSLSCAEECDADCGVCALDFGEETSSICQK